MSERIPGWETATFEDICDYIQRGKGPKYTSKNDFPVVNQKAVRWHGIESEHLKYVDPAQWDKWDEVRYIREGDILWNSTGTGTIGRACYVDVKELNKAKVVDSHVTIVRTNGLICSKYIFYWIMHPHVQRKITGLYTGSTNQVELNKSLVLGVEAPLPPLAEQKEIAARLDDLLAQVDAIKTRLDAIPAILKRFRQSVLAAAVSGKLTEEWREGKNLEVRVDRDNGKGFNEELFAAAKASLFEVPSKWITVPSSKLFSYVTSGSRGWSKYYSDSGALFVRMTNLKYISTTLDMSDVQFVDLPDSVEGKRSLIAVGDLLISITADVGRVAHVSSDIGEAYINQHVALARPLCSRYAEYIAIAIASENVGRKQIEALKRGVTKAGLGLDDIRSLAIPLPSEEEALEIVRRVRNLLAFADQVEQRVKDAQAPVNHLTQSILAKAFRGELTEEWRECNPDLITGEDSVEGLLQRIRSARQKPAGKGKSREKKRGRRVTP